MVKTWKIALILGLTFGLSESIAMEPVLNFGTYDAYSVHWGRTSTQVYFKYPFDLQLTQVHCYVWNNTGSGNGTCRIFKGIGVTGPCLATSTITWSSEMDYPFSNVPLKANQWYTAEYYPAGGNYGDPRPVSAWKPSSSLVPDHGYDWYSMTGIPQDFTVEGTQTGPFLWADRAETLVRWRVEGPVSLSVCGTDKWDGLSSMKVQLNGSNWPNWYRSIPAVDWSEAGNLVVWIKRTATWPQGLNFNFANNGTYQMGQYTACGYVSEAMVPLGMWTRVAIPLGTWTRNSVTEIHFWTNGELLGTQAIYMDGFEAISSTVRYATDYATIQNALLAGSGKVYLPPGTYNIADTLSVPAGVTLCGSGSSSVLKYAGPGGGTMVSLIGNYAAVKDLAIDGITTGGVRANYGVFSSCRNNLTMSGLDVRNLATSGLVITNSLNANSVISNNHVENVFYTGIEAINDCSYIEISDNTVIATRYSGIQIWGGDPALGDNAPCSYLTIRDNYVDASGTDNGYSVNDGFGLQSGIFIANTHYTTIQNNTALHGGDMGIDLEHSNNNTVCNNICRENKLAGIACFKVSSDNLITDNLCENNYIQNTGFPVDGGIFINDCSYRNTIENNIIRNNQAAGIYERISGNNIIRHNQIYGNGTWGIFTREIPQGVIPTNTFNNLIVSNNGGVGINGDGKLVMENDTVANNTGYGLYVASNGQATVKNAIIYANSDNIYNPSGSVLAITYSCLGESRTGTGNVVANPLFVTGPNGDYYLSQIASGQGSNSPALDAGDPNSALMPNKTTRTDQTVDSGRIDMGYHYPAPILVMGDFNKDDTITSVDIDLLFEVIHTGSTNLAYDLDNNGVVNQGDMDYLIHTLLKTRYGDANLDGRIDVGDLGIVAANYGLSAHSIWSTGDFNGDAVVDVGDLGILAANYGSGVNATVDFNADYAMAFGTTQTSEETIAAQTDSLKDIMCAPFAIIICSGILQAFCLISMEKTKRENE